MSFERSNFGRPSNDFDRGFGRDQRGGVGRLPFDHTRMDMRNFIQNTRDLPDFKIGNLFDFGQYDITLYEALVSQIQKNTDHPLYIYAYNLFSRNGYQNQEFAHLVKVFAALVAYKLQEFGRANPDVAEVIYGEAEYAVNAAVGALCLTPPVDQLVEESADRVIQEFINNWSKLEANYERMVGGSRGGGFRDPRGGGNYQAGLGTSGGGYQSGPGLNPQSVTAKLYQNQPAYQPYTMQPAAAQPSYQGARMSPPQQPAAPAAPTPAPRGVLIDKRAMLDAQPINQVPPPAPAPPAPALEVEPPPSPSQSKSFLQRNNVKVRSVAQMYDRREEPDGSIVVPAIRTGITPDYSPEHPPVVYDRRSRVLFHVKGSDGKVRERIEESNPDMDYLRHELDGKLKQVYEANQALFSRETVVPTLLDARPLIPTQNGVIAFKANDEQRKQLDEAGAPRTILRPIRADNLTDAKFKARMELARLGLDSDAEYLEYQVEEIALACQEPGTREVVQALKNCQSFEELRDEMVELQRTDVISDSFAEILDKRVTTAFLRYTQRSLSIPLRIDSFIVDYDDFLEAVKEYGSRVLGKVEEGIKVVTSQAFMILPTDATVKYLEESGEVPEEVKENLPAIFVNRYSITELPWTGADMALSWRLEGVVTPENAKHFHEALTAIHARTRTNDVFEHILLTEDGQPIYSYAAPLAEGNFMITIKKPKEPKSFFERLEDAKLNQL